MIDLPRRQNIHGILRFLGRRSRSTREARVGPPGGASPCLQGNSKLVAQKPGMQVFPGQMRRRAWVLIRAPAHGVVGQSEEGNVGFKAV